MEGRVFAAVVLAGGAGRRLGGPTKPMLAVAGRPMLAGVLAAVPASAIRLVVGPPELRPLLPPGVLLTQEQPPGSGPAAALVAGLAALPDADRTGQADHVPGAERRFPPGALRSTDVDTVVVVLAADLPLLTATAVGRLVAVLTADTDGAGAEGASPDGAVYVDDAGRPQWLCGAWRLAALRSRCAQLALTGPVAGRSLRELVAPLRVVEVTSAEDPPPWYDCDTPEQVRAVEALAAPAAPDRRRDNGLDRDMGGRS